MTLSDIKSAFEQDRVLQQTFGSWDNYSSYIAERQNLVDTGQILDRWEQDSQLWDEQFLRALGNRGGPNAQQISSVIQDEMNRRNNVEAGVQTDLNNQYGIQSTIIDTNGNELAWNGSGYSLIERPDDNLGRTLAITIAATALAGPLAQGIVNLGVAQGIAISNTVAAGMAGGIINSATQLALTRRS